MNSCYKILFQSRSICDRNTTIGAKDLWSETLNQSNAFRWYSRFRDWRELVEDNESSDRPQWTRTEVNIAAVADLVKNYRRIASRMITESLDIPKASSSDSERGYGKEKFVCMFCSTLLDTWAKGRSSHVLPRQIFFLNKVITEDETSCFAYDPETEQQILNGLVRHLLGRKNWNSKGPASRPYW